MKAAIVASSRPAFGRRPRLHYPVEFRWGEEQDVVMMFRNRGAFVFRNTALVLSRDVLAAAPVPDEIARPYALHAAQVLEGRGIVMGAMLAAPIIGELTALALAHDPTRDAEHEDLAGCALVYANDAGVPVSILLCGLAADISMVMDEIPSARRSSDIPPPFEIDSLKHVSDDFRATQRYEY